MHGNVITLLLTGDVMLGGGFLNFKERQGVGYEYPFEAVKKLSQKADILFGNLECTLSKDGIPRKDKSMALYAPPESVSALKYLGHNVISLGNNHINDYGPQGLERTMQILENNNIPFFGAGRNLAEANQELIIDRNGIKVAFLGYTTDESHVKSKIATSDSAGCVFYHFSKIAGDIDKVRNKCDLICISLHWGYEDYSYPLPKQVKLAHQVIDHGADIIIGHHPHTIQGYERYKGGVIFYSLGNFFFPDFCHKNGARHVWPKESDKSIIAQCQIGRGGVEQVEIFPCFREENYRLALLSGEQKDKAISNLARISLSLGNSDYGKTLAAYRKSKLQEDTHTLLQRLRELGLGAIIKRISVNNIMYAGLLLVRFVASKLRWRAS